MNCRILFLLMLAAAPSFGQSAPPAKTYQWHHPWFKTEVTSPTPPTWPYRIIKEQNGVIQVEVAPPGETAPEIASTDPKPARFRYIDPDTGKSVTSATPPAGYSWEKKRIEGDGTVFLKITGRKFADRPAARAPRPAPPRPAMVESHQLLADFDIEKHCHEVSKVVGGSYRIEQSCRDREREAKRRIEAMVIPPEIERHCTKVGEVIGGSYSIMKGCIEREIEAKANLH